MEKILLANHVVPDQTPHDLGLHCCILFLMEKILLANHVVPDQTPHDLGLHCLPMTLFMSFQEVRMD